MRWTHLSRAQGWAALAAIVGGLAGAAGLALGSDHQDTPLVELNPRMDLTDVYAFPNPSDPGRIVLVMNTSGFLDPSATNAAFDPNLLYQFKIDNTGDALEDKVIQITFSGKSTSQTVEVRGPVAPPVVGAMMNKVDRSTPVVSGGFNQNLGTPSGIQVFAGPADDAFFLDLEAAFCILPDRRPVTGSLSQPCAITLPPASFRPAGQAVNYIAGFNVLTIVVELPTAMLEANSGPGKIGVWGTISR